MLQVEKEPLNNSTDTMVLKLIGSLDNETVNDFTPVGQEAVEAGFSKFLVQASELKYVSSSGLGALIVLLNQVKEFDGCIKIAGLTEEVDELFHIMGFHKLFELYPTMEEAEASLNG